MDRVRPHPFRLARRRQGSGARPGKGPGLTATCGVFPCPWWRAPSRLSSRPKRDRLCRACASRDPVNLGRREMHKPPGYWIPALATGRRPARSAGMTGTCRARIARDAKGREDHHCRRWTGGAHRGARARPRRRSCHAVRQGDIVHQEPAPLPSIPLRSTSWTTSASISRSSRSGSCVPS